MLCMRAGAREKKRRKEEGKRWEKPGLYSNCQDLSLDKKVLVRSCVPVDLTVRDLILRATISVGKTE